MPASRRHFLRGGFLTATCAAVGVFLFTGCSRNPNQQLLREADDLIDHGQLDRAYSQLEDLYRREPKLNEAREMQIVILLKQNQIEAAIEKYKGLINRTSLVTFLNETIRDDD